MPLFFFFNDTATTEIYTLSLHDALPIYLAQVPAAASALVDGVLDGHETRPRKVRIVAPVDVLDRKSTRLNSSHSQISYAVFCLKKKKYCRMRALPDVYTMSRQCRCVPDC